MVLEGVGLEDKLTPAQRAKVEGLTASHLMFGFAGAERNCNPRHVRGVQGGGRPAAPSWPCQDKLLAWLQVVFEDLRRTRAGWAACTTGCVYAVCG
jgi:hypothetical protein